MNPAVAAAVLGAAVLHGTWNAIAKAIPDRLASSTLIGLVYLVLGAVGCLLLPAPAPASWPYLAASVLVQTLYLVLLTAAYAHSEFSVAYPMARGSAVLGVTVFAVAVLGERFDALQTAGIVLVIGALLSLPFIRRAGTSRVGTLLAVATGATIAVYTVLDGIGVRQTAAPLGYASWGFLLQGIAIPVVCLLLARDRRVMLGAMRSRWVVGSIGGVLSRVAYATVLWAQSVAPLALVSALRETSVLLAGVIGLLLFHEPFSKARTAATAIAVVGVLALQLGMP